MKIIQVNCVYKKGSTGKIVADIHKVLINRGIESVVCYGRDRKPVKQEKGIHKFCYEWEGDLHHLCNRYFAGLSYGGNLIPTRRLIAIIAKEQPDIVHLHCINGFCVNIYDLLKYLGHHNFRTIITHHAEFFYTGNCGHAYDCNKWQSDPGCGKCPILSEATGSRTIDRSATGWKKMKAAVGCLKRENLLFTAVSPWVRARSLLSSITKGYDCVVVENGLETDIFHPRTDLNDLYERIGGKHQTFVFHATASFTLDPDHIKGGYYIAALARMMPDTLFVVAALQVGDMSEIPENVILWGAAKDQHELARLYSAATATVITSRRETFSMITAESLCCGTPVVGFKAGGPETIALPEFSRFAVYGDTNELARMLQAQLATPHDAAAIATAAHARYSKEHMTSEYLKVYNKILQK